MNWLRHLFGLDRLDLYTQRPDQTDVWHERYPACPARVEQFLEIINGAFLLEKQARNRISPDDDIETVYRACTGDRVDSMEYEHLIFMTEDAFHCSYTDTEAKTFTNGTFGAFFAEACRRAGTRR